MLSIPLLQSYPFIALFSGLALYVGLSTASILKNILSVSSPLHLFNRLLDIFGCKAELYILYNGRLVIFLFRKVSVCYIFDWLYSFLWDLDHYRDRFIPSTKPISGKCSILSVDFWIYAMVETGYWCNCDIFNMLIWETGTTPKRCC